MVRLFGLLFAAALVLAGCGATDDDCTRAGDKLEMCGLTNSQPGMCDTAVDQCEADCINQHTCEEISAALTGTQNAYSACDDACH